MYGLGEELFKIVAFFAGITLIIGVIIGFILGAWIF
jgi:hypothetical protein